MTVVEYNMTHMIKHIIANKYHSLDSNFNPKKMALKWYKKSILKNYQKSFSVSYFQSQHIYYIYLLYIYYSKDTNLTTCIWSDFLCSSM